MICASCDTPIPAAWPAPEGALCPECGALLPSAGLARRLVAKITQLARFGLADRAAPILKPSDPPSAA
ncbi:MAG TPA: hypothetical protein VE966_14765 [Gemmatimonadales bacterium]|nr:hypothetical protein [Gemmatimonadales bacterium]